MPDGKSRILFVNDHLGWDNQIHGVTRLFQLWGTHLNPEKYDVTVCILNERNGLASVLEDHGIKTIFLGRGKYDPVTLIDLVRIIRRERIDLLHIQGYRTTNFGRLAGLITGVPMVMHFHDTTPNYPLVQNLSDSLLRRIGNAYLAVSESAKRCWAERCRLDPDRIQVLFNCASLREFKPLSPDQVMDQKERLGIPADYKVVGTVARLFPDKGTRYLLEAAPAVLERFPKTAFVIVGDGPLRGELEALAESLGITDNVRFVGFRKEVAPVMGIFDMNVVASFSVEGGSPLPVLEAMAMGKPTIATNVVEVVEDGFNGAVIPPRDPALLAQKILYLLGDEDETLRLSKNAFHTAPRYDVKEYMTRLEEVYEPLLARRRQSARAAYSK